jgi:predicted MFS family arabinose efflux permease
MNNTIDSQRLFFASRIALIATAMTFAIRANLINPLGLEFGIEPREMGIVLGTAFWGFALSIVIGGFLCDILGMRRLLWISFIAHLLGIVLTIFATGFWTLFFSTLLIGIANGMVEAACNPLVATLFPEQKTAKLNQFHVWFPGGIVIGGLIAFVLDHLGLNWKWQLATILVPTISYGVLFYNQTFPATERVQSGISTKAMIRECARPLFIFMLFCMLVTSATELGTNQWIVELLENVGIDSILLLVLINGLMMLGRSYAGVIEHRLSSSGMLLGSAIFSAIGLFLLGRVSGYASFGAAAVFAIGICFFWPTMLGFVSEHLPKTGALGLAFMGSAGMLSVAFILPFIGDFYQSQTMLHFPKDADLDLLTSYQEGTIGSTLLKQAKLAGGADTLSYVAILPVILVIAFTILKVTLKTKNNSK